MKSNLLLTAALSLSLCAASTAQTLPAYLPTDGLVGWWPFNGNANDESGNGNNGVVNGATLTEDRFGNFENAFFFDGLTHSIQVPHNSIYNFQSVNRYTLSYWIKPSGLSASQAQVIIMKQEGVGISQTGWNSFIEPNFKLNFYVKNGSSNLHAGCNHGTVVEGEFQHVVQIFESDSVRTYLDGVLVGTEFSNGAIVGDNASALYFGMAWWGLIYSNTRGYSGSLDDIAIYNRALSPDEITALYTGEPVNPPTACNPLPSNLQNGLVGYWPFCGNANDESGNGNDGTVNGATLTEDRFGVENAAYSFDGVDDYINCGNNSVLNLTNFSLSVWYNLNNLPVSVFDENVILVKSDYDSGTLGYRIAISTEPSTDSYFIWSQMGGGNSCGDYTNTNETIDTLEWTHLVATKNGGTITIYKDGIEKNSNSGLCGSFNNNNPLFIGCSLDIVEVLNYFFDGSLDDIGIWNRALTAEEVQQLYTLNACTFTIYDTVTVTETIYDTVSVSVSTTDTLIINTLITAVEPAQENTFLVYPNPASTQITINNGNVAILGGYTMRISNSLGQDVYNQNITQPEVTLDLSTWGGNGLYVLYIVDPQQNMVAVKQIVLQ